ncbi:Ig-like domain repeat protein [Nocardioides gilvus]|uniref:Ig-like domain repeat protein n=1 Tax=Nocardioides gilvus TaxID=1735589 RepID=UPI000D745F22|nr:Ig-like domain repeat protein [Nocardioides gilvus]
MKSLLRTTTRGIAAGVAGVLVAGTAALVAAPAQAAPVTGDLQWNVSQQFVEHLFFSKMGPMPAAPTGTVSGGATHTAGDLSTGADDFFTFSASDAVVAADGTVTTSFTGSVRGAFVAAGAEQYSVTVANPVVVLEADGDGAIRATVSGSVGTDTPTPAAEVTVARFTAATTADGVTSAVPNWEGVLAAGSAEATRLGITNPAHLTGGKSFHPDFLGALAPGTLAHFHNSSATAAQDHKRPGSFSFAADEVLVPTIAATVLLEDHEKGLSIKAEGSGFTAVTNPGDAGVYVALVKAGTTIDFSDRASMGAIPAVDYVVPGRFQGDRFVSVLNAPTEKLETGADYVIVTWQAHTHSNSTQDTTTPVTIDWSKFVAGTPAKVAAKAALQVTRKATLKKTGTATVILTGTTAKPTGDVTVTTKAPGLSGTAKKTVKISNGRAVVTLPRAKKGGRYTVTATYAGDTLHQGAAEQTKSFVVKAAAKSTVKVTRKATTKRAGKARITVTGKTTAGVAKARGKVKVTIQAPGKKVVKRTVKLAKSGKVVVKLPKAGKKGTYRITVKYVGDKNYTAAKKKSVRHKVR